MAIIAKVGRKHWKTRLLLLSMYGFLVFGAATMVYPFLLMIAGSVKSGVDIKRFDVVPRFLIDDTWLYRKHMEGLFNERVLNLAVAYDRDALAFDTLEPPDKVNHRRAQVYAEFLAQTHLPHYAVLAGYMETPVSRTMSDGLRAFKTWLIARYGSDIAKVNRRIGAEFVGWNSVSVPPERYLLRREKPADTPFMRHLAEFKMNERPWGLRALVSPEGFYKRMFLKSRHGADIAAVNRAHGTTYASYDAIRLPRAYPRDAPPGLRADWETFTRHTLALHWLRAEESARPAYHAFLEAKYGAVAMLNRHYGTDYAAFADAPLIEEPPTDGMAASDWEAFVAGWTEPDTGRQHRIPIDALRIHSPEFMFRDDLAQRFGALDAVNAALDTRYKSWADIALPQREFHAVWFSENRGALRREFVTRNYRTVAEFLMFRGRGIVNTVIYTFLAVLTALLINPIAAYALSRSKMAATYKILLFLLCTMAFPPMVTQIPNFIMLRQLGLLNTFAALVLPGMANGFSIFLLKGFFDAQPRELYESATLDGAGEWTLFWQMTMSLSKPILAVIALSAFTAAYSNFMFAFVVCQDERMWTLMVWLYQLQQRSGQAVMYASLIVAAIPTFLIFLFCQNLIMRGIVIPSEK